LPIRGQILVLAVVLGLLLLSLPSLVVTLLVGSVFLRVPIAPHPIALIAIPMCAIPLSGIGALIGSMARTPQELGSWALFVTMVMAGLGPVVVPPDRLPRFLVLLGRFSPATYAASALRQAFLGPVTG
jgi:ABC-2 type transport system permease protein